MKAKLSESPVFQSLTTSHDWILPNREKMISRSRSSVTLLSFAMKISFLGTSTSACGRSPIISSTCACDLAFLSASRRARSSGSPSESSSGFAPYGTLAPIVSAAGGAMTPPVVSSSADSSAASGSASAATPHGSSRTWLDRTRASCHGLPVSSRYKAPSFSSTSRPSATSPTTQCKPSSRCVRSSPRSVKKNCEPYAPSSPSPPPTFPTHAIDSKPAASCFRRFSPDGGSHSTNRPSGVRRRSSGFFFSFGAGGARPPDPVPVGSPVWARHRGCTL
mmetsp:Transcript_2566/g.9868  ORF Transcript_2566/g.9868 Transcript_2566/m.9868 type:complete len:277 (+) Transcript_2566:716-1546(+)